MDIFINSVPQWVSVFLLIGMIIPIFMISNAVKMGAMAANYAPAKVRRLSNGVVLFFLLYYLLVGLLSFTTLFEGNALPPRILVFTALPLLAFYFLFVFRTKTYWEVLAQIPLSSLVRIHTFRFVGLFFIIAWYYGILPKQFAWTAGIGDIFVAVTAIGVARLADQKANLYKKIALIWNIIGFWDIVAVIVTAIYVTRQAMETGGMGLTEMAKFPFCLIPAFAPATIIFLHIGIFKRLKMAE